MIARNLKDAIITFARFEYRLVHQLFTLGRWVRLPYRVRIIIERLGLAMRLVSSRVTSTSYGESKEVWLRWFLKYRDGEYNQPYDSDSVSMIKYEAVM